MKLKLALSALLLVGLSNCGPEPKNKSNNQICDEQCQSTRTTLKASFVSGHLGNYESCPADGYSSATASSSAEKFAGDCADENCGGISNCEKASVILRLSISGDNAALGILVQKIELKNEAGDSLAVLPLEAVTLVENNEQFSGKVKINETPSIRIDFQGPVNVRSLLSEASDSGRRFSMGSPTILHITLSAQNAEDVIIVSPIISAVPPIAT